MSARDDQLDGDLQARHWMASAHDDELDTLGLNGDPADDGDDETDRDDAGIDDEELGARGEVGGPDDPDDEDDDEPPVEPEDVSGGMVFLVGAGPGDPGLLTVRARELLDSADAVVYDALANPVLLPPKEQADRFYVGKRGGRSDSFTQEEINDLIVRLARMGKRVVRLKGGDPFVFGRGSEEAQACNEALIPFEVVPGVTAGIAAPAYAGIPVTHRGLATSVTFVTGHEDPAKPDTQTDWSAIAKTGGTIVLYMGVKTLPNIAAALIAGGLPKEIPAAAIQWGTHAKQRTVVSTLEHLSDDAKRQGVTAPVITVIGWAVVLRDEVAWFDKRPLFGKRIVVTRATAQASALSERLREQGAEVIEMPAIRMARLDLSPLRAAIARLDMYDWLMFTSQNAVSLFWEQLFTAGRDSRSLAGVKVCAVGPATAAALLERGIATDLMPERFVAEGLLDLLRERDDVQGSSVLYVAAEGARDVLPAGLHEMGAEVEQLAIYRSVVDGAGADALRERIQEGSVDLVTFTSASGVQGYMAAVGEEMALKVPAASIGPITSDAVREAGIEVAIEATESTVDGLVEAILGG